MAFDAFLKIDGITGELQGGELHLESFSWGVSNSASSRPGGGADGGKPSFQDFSFTSRVGKQSPHLFGSVAVGRLIPTATLTVGDKVEPITVRFSDVFISSYKLDEGTLLSKQGLEDGLSAGRSSDIPVESVSFNFAKIEFHAGGQIV